MTLYNLTLLFLINSAFSCSPSKKNREILMPAAVENTEPAVRRVYTGADQIDRYIDDIKTKNVALVINHTSQIEGVNLVDTFLSRGINVKKIFAPEHGFRGTADAGENIDHAVDEKTGLNIISLHGTHKKPTPADLAGINLVIFDIQDVGVRFYTYISTMHYVMEACAENNIELMILDRPNPNGYYVDGPVLKKGFTSFVGLHPVPIVHGMTIGEYAQMINGEKWLKDSMQCKLQVIKCKGYEHDDFFVLPISPSPNLPNIQAVFLYPSVCLFEGTVVSVGRGTGSPFQVVGHPKLKNKYDFHFIPQSKSGAKSPPLMGKPCYGLDLTNIDLKAFKREGRIRLRYLMDFYNKFPDKSEFFNNFFNKLAGNDILKLQIEAGSTEAEIRKSWEADLTAYKKLRKKYLLYRDFE